LWWIDAAMAVSCGVLIPYFMFTRHQHSLDGMTAVWLLPVVAAEVTAASGGLLAPHLAQGSAQFGMLVTSYILWAYSVPVAFSILALLILRMALHKLPHEGMAASSWLALGPIGTGALGMLVLGGDAPRSWLGMGWPMSALSPRASAQSPVCCSGALASGGWRSPRSSPGATGGQVSRSTLAGGAIPSR
jgi:tellurite resistance protein TehA-like permease